MKKNSAHLIEQKKEAIMTQNRHQLIYAKKGQKRDEFLSQLVEEYPVKFDAYSPIAIYVEDAILPEVKQANPNIDINMLNLLGLEYFNLSIVHSISKAVFSFDESAFDEVALNSFLLKVHSSWAQNNYLYQSDTSLDTLSSLTRALEKSKSYYYKFYLDYMQGKEEKIDITKLPFAHIDPIEYAEAVKNLINNKAYFCAIINYEGNGFESSRQAVNEVIGKRCNATVSVKLFTSVNDWDLYYTFGGPAIEFTRDYGEVDFDGSKRAYSKSRDRRWFL